jgi:hypothetical protein
MMGSGLINNADFRKIAEQLKNSKSDNVTINLTVFLKRNYLSLNKPLRTIFKFSKRLVITDKKENIKLKFVWENFDKNRDYSEFPDSTPIYSRDCFDEDDVTYVTVHNILRVNKFKILAVSYPGAQGDRAILIQPGTGRKQERKYVDVISYLPNKFTNLQENKGVYAKTGVQNDIHKVVQYKTKTEYKDALIALIRRIDSKAPLAIKVGVGFWANKKFTLSDIKNLDISQLDYFIYLAADRKEWVVWSNGQNGIFTETKGNIEIPETYEVGAIIDLNDED